MFYSSASNIQYSKFWRFYNMVAYAQNDAVSIARITKSLESVE